MIPIGKEKHRALASAFVRCRQYEACMRRTARTMHKQRYHEAAVNMSTAWVLAQGGRG